MEPHATLIRTTWRLVSSARGFQRLPADATQACSKTLSPISLAYLVSATFVLTPIPHFLQRRPEVEGDHRSAIGLLPSTSSVHVFLNARIYQYPLSPVLRCPAPTGPSSAACMLWFLQHTMRCMRRMLRACHAIARRHQLNDEAPQESKGKVLHVLVPTTRTYTAFSLGFRSKCNAPQTLCTAPPAPVPGAFLQKPSLTPRVMISVGAGMAAANARTGGLPYFLADPMSGLAGNMDSFFSGMDANMNALFSGMDANMNALFSGVAAGTAAARQSSTQSGRRGNTNWSHSTTCAGSPAFFNIYTGSPTPTPPTPTPTNTNGSRPIRLDVLEVMPAHYIAPVHPGVCIHQSRPSNVHPCHATYTLQICEGAHRI